MSDLKKFLEECKEAYYAGNPIISDSQYDALEDAYNGTLDVGTNAGRTKHWYPMYSLRKYYEDEDYPKDKIYYVTPKLDGAAIALRYINGTLDSVVTRGDGKYGEDISHLFQDKIVLDKCDIPEKLPGKFTVQITGEMVSPKTISNARNYASGALSLKDSKEFFERTICFKAYDMQESKLKSFARTLATLVSYGFETVACQSTEDYPQDGLVYRVDCNTTYKEMGYTSKHPRGAFALKRRSKGIKTIILDVIWQTGKTGKVTPVALLEPIEIEGATVSRATLNNPGFIEALGVQIGDSVYVERAGGIIPRIIRKAE